MEISQTNLFNNWTSDHAEQAKANIQMEILKRLGGWHPLEVPTLCRLSLSHVIPHLPSQREEPLSAPFELFERCFSNASLINYLASKHLLIPFLKRLPTETSLRTLNFFKFKRIGEEELNYFLKAFGKKLRSLQIPNDMSFLQIDQLALLVPELEEINSYFSIKDVLQTYPLIRRIGLRHLYEIEGDPQNDKILALIQGCTNLESEFIINSYNLENDDINILNQFNNLTRLSLTIAKIDIKTRLLFKSLTQLRNLTKLSLNTDYRDIQTEKSNDDNTEALEFPNIRKIKGNIPLFQKHLHATFPNAKIKLYLNSEGEEYLETFLTIHQKIMAITYNWTWTPHDLHHACENIFKSENFRKVVEIARSTLKSIDLGINGEWADADFNEITHCPNLKRFVCNNFNRDKVERVTKQAFVNLFKAVCLKSIKISEMPCDDKAIKKLMKKSHSSLTELKIVYCPITDASVRRIAKFGRGLTTLKLTQCENITANALTDLVKWTPNLKTCALGGKEGLSKVQVALISQRLPNLKSINLTIDLSDGNFIKEAHEYFLKYIQLRFFSIEDVGDEITEESTPTPWSIFERKVNRAKQQVVNNIQNIVKRALENHEITITSQDNQEEVFAKAKAEFEQFTATHIAEDKIKDFNKLPHRVQNVVNLLIYHSVKELIAASSMRSFIDSMITFTSETTRKKFFLTQPLSIGYRLTEQLEETFSESILDQFLDEKRRRSGY